jgi:uncharacterized protein with gpF-like domain
MRKYLPTFAELIDRLSIVILKSIFIPENKEAYEHEQELIMHDIDELLQEKQTQVWLELGDENHNPIINAKTIRAIMIVQLTNRYIWENESKARQGGSEQDKLLKLTHSINGVRNTAKNVIANEMGERVDLKIDALAAELTKEFGNWNIF